jgi:hypothetical protein
MFHYGKNRRVFIADDEHASMRGQFWEGVFAAEGIPKDPAPQSFKKPSPAEKAGLEKGRDEREVGATFSNTSI